MALFRSGTATPAERRGLRRLIAFLAVSALMGSAPADSLRVGSYNTQSLGTPGDPDWSALVQVLRRVDADAAALQEVIGTTDRDHIDELAQEAGYAYWAISQVSGTLSGNERTAVLSHAPVLRSESYSAAELSGDPDANDITRDIFAVWLEASPGSAPWIVVTVHLKAGTSDTSKFRRQIEIQRIVQALDRIRLDDPGSPILLTGDFNQDPRQGPFGAPVFDAPPADLPTTYRLGSDITFPVIYDPYRTLEDAGMIMLEAFHEDDPGDPVTHPATFRILDLLWVEQHGAASGTEIYDSCDDNGVDDPPPGYWLPKAGVPLNCGVSTTASDHLDLFGDIERLPVDQDGDGIDDSVDCAVLDPLAGTPLEVESLRAETVGASTTRFTWTPASTADRYDVARGALGTADDFLCRTNTDDDPTDTEFLEPAVPAAGSGWHYLVRALDDACGGAGPWGADAAAAACPSP
ncbi:MAG: endonuclease/exonuclease/phosphatase family protein [Acidobacteriota bacterium]|nr:endonuclease/exonuclease/phosphatase family protein [Acidobacteriota bacterium]MDQ7086599.1 endonuclease/exonuclease/phosphatase family protein [Acidobacteriota bacterium]